MAKSLVKGLTDEEVLRFLRFKATESAAGIFTQVSYDTQLSIERGVIWMIHAVEWFMPWSYLDIPAAGVDEFKRVQITRESQPGVVYPDDSDLVAFHTTQMSRSAAIGTDAGPIAVPNFVGLYIQNFPIPIPYAAQNIFVGIYATLATPQTVYGRIHYTIRSVPEAYFYRVAQALIG